MKAKIFALLFTMLLFMNGCSDNNSQDCNSGYNPDSNPEEPQYPEVNLNPGGNPVKVKTYSNCYGTLIQTVDDALFYRKYPKGKFEPINSQNTFPFIKTYESTEGLKNDSCYFLTNDNRLFSMGKDHWGSLGLGPAYRHKEVLEPTEIKGIEGKIRDVYTFGGDVYAVTENKGKDILYIWGGAYGYNKDTPTELTIDGVNKIFNIYNISTYEILKTDKGFYFFNSSRDQTPTKDTNINFCVKDTNNHTCTSLPPLEIKAVYEVYVDSKRKSFILTADNKLYSIDTVHDGRIELHEAGDLNGIISTPEDIKQFITPGDYYGFSNVHLLLKADGTVYSWSDSWWSPTLGYANNATSEYNKPKQIDTLHDIIKISQYDDKVVYALDKTGKIYSWGYKGDALGQEIETEYRATPELIQWTSEHAIADISTCISGYEYNIGYRNKPFAIVKGNNEIIHWDSYYYDTVHLGNGVKSILGMCYNHFRDSDVEILYDNGDLKTFSFNTNTFIIRNYL